MTGPDRGAFWFAEILTFVPTILFWIYVNGPMFANNIFLSIVVFVASLFTTGAIVYTHFKAAFVEPGIIPRGEESETPAELVKEEEIDGRNVVTTYCKTCHIWKPPRAHHCRTCNNCVKEFDHHCPWVGNCVGLNNYKWFNLFLWSVVLGCTYIFSVSAVSFGLLLSQENTTVIGTITTHPFHLGEIIYSLFICLSVASLCGYHCSLMCKGKTTYESIKKLEEGSDNRTGWQRLWDTITVTRESSINLFQRLQPGYESENDLFLDA